MRTVCCRRETKWPLGAAEGSNGLQTIGGVAKVPGNYYIEEKLGLGRSLVKLVIISFFGVGL